MVEAVRVGVPSEGCDDEGDVGYDGISPDHFCVQVATDHYSNTPAEPFGRDVLYLTINVNGNDGEFEFDTACFAASLNMIYMIDNEFQPADHGPGSGDFDHFTKGIITIARPPPEYYLPWMSINGGGDDQPSASYRMMFSVAQSVAGFGTSAGYEVGLGCWYGAGGGGNGGDCFCGGAYPTFGDITCDAAVNPVDVVKMVNYVYKGIDDRCPPPPFNTEGWNCPVPPGDVTCDGEVNPVDVVRYVNYVYKGITPFPCDPCG